MSPSKPKAEAKPSRLHGRDNCPSFKAPPIDWSRLKAWVNLPVLDSLASAENQRDRELAARYGGLGRHRLIYDRESDAKLPPPLFANLEQESNAEDILLSIANPEPPRYRFTPLDNQSPSAKGTSRIYHPLPEANAFRLLEILAGECDVVQCKLHVCSLQESETTYEALSYTWAKPDDSSNRKIEIISNGGSQTMSISGSLYIALRELRRSNASRVLWADAICINQEDVKERGQQVAMMGQIFSGAWQVVIWLGEEEDRCMCGNTVLETSLSSASKGFSGLCSLVNDWLAQAGQETFEATYSEISKDGQSTIHRANIYDAEDNDTQMMQLFCRRWFSRIWVLQEATLARHAVVQLGSYLIPWEWVGLAAAIVVHEPKLYAAGYTPDASLSRATNTYLMYRLSISQKCFPRLEFSFAQLLRLSRKFNSKEPKDKVYGLLGIGTTDSVGKQIVPDYSETTSSEKAFEDTARIMLQSASPLTFLSGAGTFGLFDRSGPSWVPSWHEYRPWTILPTEKHPGFQCASGTPMELKPGNEAGELVLKGVIIDHISSVQEHHDVCWNMWGDHDEIYDNFLSQPRWSEEAWRKCAMTLTCGGDGRAYPIDDETAHLTSFAALVLLGRAHWIMTDLIALQDIIEPEGDGMTQTEYLEQIDRYGDARGYISALEPLQYYYRLFKTASKDFGVGPVDMKIGDKLCVLFGAEVPFLLRPKGDGYLVVGECYVYDLMHGEVLEKLAADPDAHLKAQWIKLI
ncbi:Het6 heterokaryon incompatibility protein [Fusarium tjaetaba]|uniref:Het6 heterokaryon incompatibility protein n=1 Tax=Fusarium tjaetaba TaxID=1567544 RepID=A0A8H5W5G3_9HYPO|nr:Het6 heterokaryon incompatibility protein [Fusarium tjaetaba]KAF5649817.1 Het6 heterokaryon incompatibility protein [Fusarium tjaetaba]